MPEPKRLAVFNETSLAILPFFEVTREHCRIVWVVGWSPTEPPIRMLSRFGEVVDVTGMEHTEAVDVLANLRLDGVVVFSDPPITLAAGVAARLGLPFHSPQTARLLTDKMAQRTALRDAGLPVPAFVAIRSGERATGVTFPAVLKPRSGAASRDTFQVNSAEEVAAALAVCDPHEEFILEEWLADRDAQPGLASNIVSVESVTREGVIEHLIVTGRFPFAPPFRETGLFMPSDLDRADKEAVTALAGRAIEAMGVPHGLLHTEIKMTPDGPRIVEINGRIGGSVDQLMRRIGGPSLNAWAVQLALGMEVGPVPVFPPSPVAFFHQVQAPQLATGVESIEGLEELVALHGVGEVQVQKPPGSALDFKKGSVDEYVVKIDGLADSYGELADLNQQIASTLEFTWRYRDTAEGPVGA